MYGCYVIDIDYVLANTQIMERMLRLGGGLQNVAGVSSYLCLIDSQFSWISV